MTLKEKFAAGYLLIACVAILFFLSSVVSLEPSILAVIAAIGSAFAALANLILANRVRDESKRRDSCDILIKRSFDEDQLVFTLQVQNQGPGNMIIQKIDWRLGNLKANSNFIAEMNELVKSLSFDTTLPFSYLSMVTPITMRPGDSILLMNANCKPENIEFNKSNRLPRIYSVLENLSIFIEYRDIHGVIGNWPDKNPIGIQK